MSLPSLDSPVCAICHLPIMDGVTVPTTTGGVVHIRCAERQATASARRRAIRAAASAALLTLLLVLAVLLGIRDLRLGAVLALLLVAAHIRLNRRWWHYTVQSARLWWRWW